MWKNRQELSNYVKNTLSQLERRARKKLGQNFLVEPKYVRMAIQAADLSKERDWVLEIGGGLGSLSLPLSEHARKLTIVERDPVLANYLQELFHERDNVEIIEGDALAIDFQQFDKTVANIPYQISAPLFERLIKAEMQHVVLMVQKEFADRLQSEPGTKSYSRLSLQASLLKIKQVAIVKPSAFLPAPKVMSVIVEWEPISDLLREWRALQGADHFARTLFSMKNKTLGSIVSTRISKARRANYLEKDARLQLPPKVTELRPRNLDIQTFMETVRLLSEHLEEVDEHWEKWFFLTT